MENHVSVDGKFVLDCKNGLKIHKFKVEKQGGREKIVLEEQKWQLPIKTEDIEHV